MIQSLTAQIRTVKLSTAVMALFAAALVIPWFLYAWVMTIERAQTLADRERELGALASAYAEHAASLIRLGLVIPLDSGTQDSREPGAAAMARFAKGLGRPDVRFALRAFGTPAPTESATIAATADRAGTGLTAEAALPRAVALAPWRHRALVSAIALLIRTLIAIAVGALLVAQLRWRERAAAELAEAKRVAESSSRSKSQFLANMSHELRTPLNAIIGFSEVIQSGMWGPLNTCYREYAGDILSSGKHLLHLINEILDLSKLEAGQFQLHEEEIDLAELVRDCLRLVEGAAGAARVELHEVVQTEVPPVRADDRRMRQIVINLLSNAVKFTLPGGYIRVALTRRNGGVAIEVSDTGIGMSPGDIAKALELFGQVDSSISRKHEGSGLGLPLAKQLIELHGGTLAIRSELYVGTTITIALPASRVTASRPHLAARAV
jgi:signal transduction histidine kinase